MNRRLLLLSLLFVSPLLFGQAPSPTPEVASDESALDLIMKGGKVMIPLFLASIVALAITFERAFGLRKSSLIPADFLDGIKKAVDDDRLHLTQAIEYCDDASTPIARIFKSGLLASPRGYEAAEKAIEDAGAREVSKLKRSLKGLSVIASVSPLLGLLGTVYGMIGAFKEATQVGVGKGESLAGGIYEALVTTATGLTIAVPVLLIYHFFNTRVDKIVDDIDEMCIDFVQHLTREGSSS